ncbi:MAG: TauD/TfdA family dioxygenase [Alphaproteobacteria bacterium]|nr:TauD/TfdA family dioxygenase [Alphaproteobacteria bacterium]
MSKTSHRLDGVPGGEVVPVSDALGAEIRGVNLAGNMDAAAFGPIYRSWLDHLVLVFRDQNLSDADLVAFSQRFGPLSSAPVDEYGRKFVDGFPEILVVSNVFRNGEPIGSLGALESKWHTDMSYVKMPPKASCLMALKLPATGGDTGFLNLCRAFETLPAALARRIEGLTLKHDATYNSVGLLREGFQDVTDVTASPGAAHPIVRIHPETGRKALFLGRRNCAYVNGLSLGESEELLDALWEHVTQERFTWHHKWRLGDLVIWDNRCTMHRRDAFRHDAERIMHRTQIIDAEPAPAGETA